MSYNGSGTFNINSTGQPVVTGTVISSSVFNALTADLATGLSTCITKDGQTTVTANIPMNSFKFTNLAAGTAAGDSVRVSQLQAGSATSLTVTGTNTYAATASPALTAYTTGNTFSFVVPNSNTSSCTLNIDSLGAKAITRDGTTALVSGDLVAGSEVLVVYDGTQFQVVNSNSKTNLNLSGTLTVAGNATFSGGTANGVGYLNGSKVLTTGSALTFDGSKLTVVANSEAIRLNGNSNYIQWKTADGVTQNGYIQHTGTDFAFVNAQNGAIPFYTNNTEQMRLTSTGLGIGTSSPAFSLDISAAGPRIRQVATTGTNSSLLQLVNSGGTAYIGLDNSSGGLGGAYSLNIFHTGAYPIIFSTSGTERARIDSSGNVGIGTSSPAYKLDVSTSGTAAARFVGAANVYADVTDGTGNFRIQLLSNVPNIGSSTNHNLNLITNNSVKATLDTSGNLGLGVTPSAWGGAFKALDIGSNACVSGTTSTQLFNNGYDSGSGYVYKSTSYAQRYTMDNTGKHIWYNAPSGTAGNAITFTQAMTLDASGNLGIGTSSPSTQLQVAGTGVFRLSTSTNTTGFDFGFLAGVTIPDGYVFNRQNGPLIFGTNNTERARIDSSGNLLVGKTSFTATSPGFMTDQGGALYVTKASSTNADATYYLYSSGASAYRFYVGMDGTVNATNTTISAISDQRFKENIRDLDIGLNAVMALKPRKFDWKAGKGKDIKNDRGFIAQEFETVFPDLIDEWKDPAPEGEEPYKSVRQDLIPVLVKAIQEQQAIIEQLKADVAALKGA